MRIQSTRGWAKHVDSGSIQRCKISPPVAMPACSNKQTPTCGNQIFAFRKIDRSIHRSGPVRAPQICDLILTRHARLVGALDHSARNCHICSQIRPRTFATSGGRSRFGSTLALPAASLDQAGIPASTPQLIACQKLP